MTQLATRNRGDRGRRARRHEEAGLLRRDQLAAAAHVGRHRDRARRHRFQHHVGKALVHRGERQDVDRGEEARHVVT